MTEKNCWAWIFLLAIQWLRLRTLETLESNWQKAKLILERFDYAISFFSHSLDRISCSGKEMCDAPIGTTSWSPAKKWNGSNKWCNVGAEGVTSQLHTTGKSFVHKELLYSPTLIEKKGRTTMTKISPWRCKRNKYNLSKRGLCTTQKKISHI